MPWNTAEYKQGLQAMRAYPPDVSRRQIQEEIPVGWRQDAGLWGFVTKYMIRGSGAGFVTPPYTAYWDRLWGATPIEDLPKYKDLYTFTPYIKAAIDVTVNLAVSNGFELEGSARPRVPQEERRLRTSSKGDSHAFRRSKKTTMDRYRS